MKKEVLKKCIYLKKIVKNGLIGRFENATFKF